MTSTDILQLILAKELASTELWVVTIIEIN